MKIKEGFIMPGNQQNHNRAGRDINQTTNIIERVSLNKNKIFDCLCAFLKYDGAVADVDITYLPAKVNTKLEFNKSFSFKEFLANHIHEADELKIVLDDRFPDSSKVLGRLKDIYIQFATRDEKKEKIPLDGDNVLENMFSCIFDIVSQDCRLNVENDVSDEEIEIFAYAFLEYGIENCQVLLNPLAQE